MGSTGVSVSLGIAIGMVLSLGLEVELWLRSLPLARSSCAKIRNLMSLLFNHGIRYEICDDNPIRLVRQSAKRRKIPVTLSAAEVRSLIALLPLRERTLVLLDFGTGLRLSELFALKWKDINFQTNEISVVRSIVFQIVGPCKTEASQKPVPLDPYLADALQKWRHQTTTERQRIGYSRVRLVVVAIHIGGSPSCEGSFNPRRRRSASRNT